MQTPRTPGAAGVAAQIRARINLKRSRDSLEGPSASPGKTTPAEITRAMAAVLQGKGVSIIDLIWAFTTSTLPPTMESLNGLIRQVHTPCNTESANVHVPCHVHAHTNMFYAMPPSRFAHEHMCLAPSARWTHATCPSPLIRPFTL